MSFIYLFIFNNNKMCFSFIFCFFKFYFSVPFSMEEIFRSFSAISLSDVDPPHLLRQRSDFHFLLQATETD